jgi:hypothetical protein
VSRSTGSFNSLPATRDSRTLNSRAAWGLSRRAARFFQFFPTRPPAGPGSTNQRMPSAALFHFAPIHRAHPISIKNTKKGEFSA